MNRIAVSLFALVLSLGLFHSNMASFGYAADEAAAEDHGGGDHGGGDHGGGHSEGPISFQADLALWSLISFLIFLFLLKKIAWGPMIEGLDKRESNIRGALEDAQKARDQAAKLLSDHEAKMANVQKEVDEIIAEARRDAEHTATSIKEKAEAEAESTRNRVLGEIDRAKDQAIAELANRERDLVASATESVLGRALTDDDRGRLIDDALSQFSQN